MECEKNLAIFRGQEIRFADTAVAPSQVLCKFLAKNLQVLWHAAISVTHVRLINRLETNGGGQPQRSEVALRHLATASGSGAVCSSVDMCLLLQSSIRSSIRTCYCNAISAQGRYICFHKAICRNFVSLVFI
jgi:hypothetical protein